MIVALCVACGLPKRLSSRAEKYPVHYDPFSELLETRCPGSNRLPILAWDSADRSLIWNKFESLPETPSRE